ncbi:MAG: hypothetical protein H7244_00625, partial [Herminiimonas sp.]|nr:hypothetical protein [Herminiimonas sp.]
ETPVGRFRLKNRRNQGAERWTLIANPHQLRLADVYRMFVFDAADDAPLVKHVEKVVEQGLTKTLAAHFA